MSKSRFLALMDEAAHKRMLADQAKEAAKWFEAKHADDPEGRKLVYTGRWCGKKIWLIQQEVHAGLMISLRSITDPMDVFEFLDYCTAEGFGQQAEEKIDTL